MKKAEQYKLEAEQIAACHRKLQKEPAKQNSKQQNLLCFCDLESNRYLYYLYIMRKFIAIVLMLLFTANICGATVTHHLCGKVLQYSSFTGHKKDSKCCCKGSGTDKGCCKTTYIKIKIDEKMALKSYSPVKKFLFESTEPSFSFVPQLTGYVSHALAEKEYIPQKVRWHKDDLLTFYCVYRI